MKELALLSSNISYSVPKNRLIEEEVALDKNILTMQLMLGREFSYTLYFTASSLAREVI